MSEARWILDPKKTDVRVRTVAEGMLAKLAKDLEIEWPAAEGSLAIDEAEGAVGEARFELDRARVVGTVRGDAVNEHGLSAGDRADIVHKLAHAVGASAGSGAVTVRATMKDEENATFDVTVPCGTATKHAKLTVTRTESSAEARGKLTLSLRALGVSPVKGPMGAFRLSDDVTVIFRATFTKPA